jgi:molybdopterin-guanine dinucleotide biosynthesis protein A
MGRDKALLTLGGRPLVEHALTKLRRVCREVSILSNNEELAAYGPVVRDLHPNCGPMAGLEAALADSVNEWTLVVPVDVPFVPTMMLFGWVRATLGWGVRSETRVSMFTVDGVPQPTLVMLHQEVGPYLTVALAQGRYKLFPEFVSAAADLAAKRGLAEVDVLRQSAWTRESRFSSDAAEPQGPRWSESTRMQEEASQIYFANLNTPADFAEAEKFVDVLDT